MAFASIKLLNAAFLLLLAFSYAHGLEYSHRSIEGQLHDGIVAHQHAASKQLRKTNIRTENIRNMVRSIARIHVFRGEKLNQIKTDPVLVEAQGIILDAILNDTCIWLKSQDIVASNSTCSLSEMKRLLNLLDLFFAHREARSNAIFDNFSSQASCYCSWVKDRVLQNNCFSPYETDNHIEDYIPICSVLCEDNEDDLGTCA